MLWQTKNNKTKNGYRWRNDTYLLTPSHTPNLEKLLHLKRVPYSTLFYIVANFILLCAACRFVVQSSFKKIDQLAWLDRLVCSHFFGLKPADFQYLAKSWMYNTCQFINVQHNMIKMLLKLFCISINYWEKRHYCYKMSDLKNYIFVTCIFCLLTRIVVFKWVGRRDDFRLILSIQNS